MSYEEAENILVGYLTAQYHLDLTGESLLAEQHPCEEAMWQAVQLLRETEAAVTDLVNDN